MGNVEKAYELARERYATIGIDTEAALKKLADIHISLHCWQADDVAGFESDGELTGGIQATGNFPGKARNIEELRADILKALSRPGNSCTSSPSGTSLSRIDRMIHE